ncbi:hypothetical protein [Bradyrhizobium liaoningense]|uniref:hypothetical protein n=1 Tax=Bradyrhizobium liaoningense TaxID=43992 RepID=UPI001BAD987B|nr:hypothetical protein [Bradyrhizobium liaoningense]MBR0986533.1 hypothetical protein [Bradyrhizobium liaoningense]
MRTPSETKKHAKPRDPSVLASRDGRLATAFAFIDTIEVFWPRRFAVTLKNALRAETRRRVWDEPLVINGLVIGWILKLNQPTESAVRVLDDLWDDRMSICRLHVAYDLDRHAGVSAKQIESVMTIHAHMRYRKTADSVRNERGTVYSIDTAYRRGRLSRTTVFYCDKPGKLDGELNKPHLEIRVLTGQAIKRLGIARPRGLLQIKPREFFSKCITMRDHAEPMIKEMKKTMKPHPLINVDRRVRGLLNRSGHGTLTDFRKEHPRQFERLKEMDVLQINDRLMWAPAKGRENDVCWGNCAYYHNDQQELESMGYDDNIDWRFFTPASKAGGRPRVRLTKPRKRVRIPHPHSTVPRPDELDATAIKNEIKTAILKQPEVSVKQLQQQFPGLSGVALAAIRTSFREDLAFLRQRGNLVWRRIRPAD